MIWDKMIQSVVSVCFFKRKRTWGTHDTRYMFCFLVAFSAESGRIWSCCVMRVKTVRKQLNVVLNLIENWKMGRIWWTRECRTFGESGLTTITSGLTDWLFYSPSTYLQTLFPQYSLLFPLLPLSAWFPLGRWSPYAFKSLTSFSFLNKIF